jgi:hypothetical protein
MKLMEPPLRQERNPPSYCLNPSLMIRIESTEHVRIGFDFEGIRQNNR